MSDRIKGLTVTLEPNVRDDDAEAIINSIRMIRRVLKVEAHVEERKDVFALNQAKHEIRMKIMDLL